MGIADNLKRSAPNDFLEAYERLSAAPEFAQHQELIPYAALAQVLVYQVERLAMRTEVECKKEIYHAMGKTPPNDNELLRQPS